MDGPLVISPQDTAFFGVIHQLVQGTNGLNAGAVGIPDSVQISGDADFCTVKHAAIWNPVAAGQVKVQFEIVPGESLHQAPVYLSAFASGRYPQYFGKTIPRGAIFRLIADDRQTIAAAASLRILHAGYKHYAKPFEPPRLYDSAQDFSYVADYTAEGLGAVAANATRPAGVSIQADHDFLIEKVGIVCDSPNATLDVQTSGKNFGWFSRACHVGLLGATDFNTDPPAGAWPFVLPVPCFVGHLATITVSFADLSGAQNRAQVVFLGKKLKPAGGHQASWGVMQDMVMRGQAQQLLGAHGRACGCGA